MQTPHTFFEEQVDERYSHVSSPQITALIRADGGLDVIVYYMLNRAYAVIGSKVISALGKTTLKVITAPPDDVVCASVTIRKARFSFEDHSGITMGFVFTS